MTVYIDLETGGLSPRYNQIFSIGVIIGDEEHLIRVAYDPRKRVDPSALRVNGIDLERWTGYPLDTAMRKLRSLCSSRVIAHNASFDAGFVAHASYETRIDIDAKWGCTLDWSRRIPALAQLRSRKLAQLHEHLCGSAPTCVHDALEDARSCKRIAQALLELDPNEEHLRIR